MSAVALGLRTYVRYLVPLTLVALVALAPIALLALGVPAPREATVAKQAMRLAYVLAGAAWLFQLWTVAAAAPLVRATAAGTSIAQYRALGIALVGLGRGALVWGCVFAACFSGFIALVVPGLVALVLFVLAPASEERGLPAPLVESARIVRAHWQLVVGLLVALVVVDVGAVIVAKAALVEPIAKKPSEAVLAAYRSLPRVAAVTAIVVAPIVACLLAAIHTRAQNAAPV